ncbi:MAG: helix-turn-helix transcriptional regulator, partial [Clostridia bacterium]
SSMVDNRIKALRAKAKISATELSKHMPDDVDKIVMHYIETGRVLPTRDGLDKMCEVFDCVPTDIYAASDIDLFSMHENSKEPKTIDLKDTPHKGMEQIRVWLLADEKAALFKAVNVLGYRSVAEWLRDMYRATIHNYISLTILHEAIPPVTKNQTIGS